VTTPLAKFWRTIAVDHWAAAIYPVGHSMGGKVAQSLASVLTANPLDPQTVTGDRR
jgi:alpha-beta hydrolase superfamily lysophospholipase